MQNKYTKKILKGFMFASISLAGCSKSTGQLGIEERAKGLTLDEKLIGKGSIEPSKATEGKVDLEAQVKECVDNKVSVEPSLKKTAEEEKKEEVSETPAFALYGMAVGMLGGAMIGTFYLDYIMNDPYSKGYTQFEGGFAGMFFGTVGGSMVGSVVEMVVDGIKKKRNIGNNWKDRHVIYPVV